MRKHIPIAKTEHVSWVGCIWQECKCIVVGNESTLYLVPEVRKDEEV